MNRPGTYVEAGVVAGSGHSRPTVLTIISLARRLSQHLLTGPTEATIDERR
ncbi:MAG: hypothetical protein ACE5F6_04750 [Anaerolineae bacterium]